MLEEIVLFFTFLILIVEDNYDVGSTYLIILLS